MVIKLALMATKINNKNNSITFRLGPAPYRETAAFTRGFTRGNTNQTHCSDTRTPLHMKIRLCQNRDNCPYGVKCNYAHSISELNAVDCRFNDKCRFVQKKDDNWTNNTSENKICYFRHPGETDDSYNVRVGNTGDGESISHITVTKPTLMTNTIQRSVKWDNIVKEGKKRSFESVNTGDFVGLNQISLKILKDSELELLASDVLKELQLRKSNNMDIDDESSIGSAAIAEDVDMLIDAADAMEIS